MNKDDVASSWQHFTRKLKKHCGRLTKNDLKEVSGNDVKFRGYLHKRYGDQKKDAACWAEYWCERGGWRDNPPAHND